MPVALSSLIDRTDEDKELLNQILSSFVCKQDEDIEYFLYNKAVEFESLSKARTYLICDEEQLSEDGFCLDQLTVYGYFSLALKILSVPETTSNRWRKELDGLSAKVHGKVINDFPCYLIGQLSRNSAVDRDSVSGHTLVDMACAIIDRVVEYIGGRYVMIECHDDVKLIQFYKDNEFFEIARIPDEERPMVQMIRKIR